MCRPRRARGARSAMTSVTSRKSTDLATPPSSPKPRGVAVLHHGRPAERVGPGRPPRAPLSTFDSAGTASRALCRRRPSTGRRHRRGPEPRRGSQSGHPTGALTLAGEGHHRRPPRDDPSTPPPGLLGGYVTARGRLRVVAAGGRPTRQTPGAPARGGGGGGGQRKGQLRGDLPGLPGRRKVRGARRAMVCGHFCYHTFPIQKTAMVQNKVWHSCSRLAISW